MGCNTSLIKDNDCGEVLLEKLTKWGGKAPTKALPSDIKGKQVKSWSKHVWQSYGFEGERYWRFNEEHNPSSYYDVDEELEEHGLGLFFSMVKRHWDAMEEEYMWEMEMKEEREREMKEGRKQKSCN